MKHLEERRHKCDLCLKLFSLAAGLRRHKQLVHTDIRPFACDRCPYAAQTNANLKRHRRNIHALSAEQRPDNRVGDKKRAMEEESDFIVIEEAQSLERLKFKQKCEECGEQFATLNRLRSHLLTHIDPN